MKFVTRFSAIYKEADAAEKVLFEAIRATFPLKAFSWDKELGIAFANQDVEDLSSKLDEAQTPGISSEEKLITKRQMFGYNRLVNAYNDPDLDGGNSMAATKGKMAIDRLYDITHIIINTLRSTIGAETMQPEYEVFTLKSRYGFDYPTGREVSHRDQKPTYLFELANAALLHDNLVKRGAYNDREALPCGLQFLEQVANSNIPELAQDLLKRVNTLKNTTQII